MRAGMGPGPLSTKEIQSLVGEMVTKKTVMTLMTVHPMKTPTCGLMAEASTC